MRPEEPDRRLPRVRGERPRRPPRRDMNSRRFIMNSSRLIGVSGWSGLKASIFAGARAAGTMWSNHEPGVCAWHKSEVLERINDVRFCGQSGEFMPAVGSSAPDP